MYANMKQGEFEGGENIPLVGVDPEFERQIAELNLTKDQQQALIESTKNKNMDLHKQIEEMKAMLRNRKERNKEQTAADHAEDLLQELSEDEKRHLLDTRTRQSEADRLMEEDATLKALKNLEQEQQRRNEELAMQELLKNVSATERDRILSQFNEQMKKMNDRSDDNRQAAMDKAKAKLAAKKRMREELDKERAVNKELDNITKTHVSTVNEELYTFTIDSCY